jgi:K+-transporting ATPase KdpF subunit
MSWIVAAAGVVACALLVYLVVALLVPEWFQ